jgi:hypothetical protein
LCRFEVEAGLSRVVKPPILRVTHELESLSVTPERRRENDPFCSAPSTGYFLKGHMLTGVKHLAPL